MINFEWIIRTDKNCLKIFNLSFCVRWKGESCYVLNMDEVIQHYLVLSSLLDFRIRNGRYSLMTEENVGSSLVICVQIEQLDNMV